jgi:hypothetical protein
MSKKLALTGIRRKWCFVGLAFMLLSPFLLSYFVRFIGAAHPPVTSWMIFWMVINMLCFFILLRCAAKKAGKKLLTLYLIFSPVYALTVFLQLCGVQLAGSTVCFLGLTFDYKETFNSYLVSYQMQGPWNVKLFIAALSYFVLFGLFYVFSVRLRNENNRLQQTLGG